MDCKLFVEAPVSLISSAGLNELLSGSETAGLLSHPAKTKTTNANNPIQIFKFINIFLESLKTYSNEATRPSSAPAMKAIVNQSAL